MEYAIAVFDIGKTNKKLVIFDNNLNELAVTYQSFPSINYKARGKREWQLEVEDNKGIEEWIVKSLALYSDKFPIRVIAFSTHGATFAAIDNRGKLAFPILSYTNEPGDSLHENFFEIAGEPDSLQLETGTARFGALLNVAQGIYFLKEEFPEVFSKVKTFLLYPQFLGYLLTGKIASDFTYAGCHTYLWNFKKSTWSSVTNKLGITERLPSKVTNPHSVLGKIKPDIAERTGLSTEVIVTVGIHDSNASLLPYLIKEENQDFILNSTGTWCVVMHPMERFYFERDELGKVVFYNLSAFGKPVKTAIFTGGLEHDEYIKIIQKINGINNLPEFDNGVYRDVIRKREAFILPTILKGSGQFPKSPPRVVEGGNVFNLSDIKNSIKADKKAGRKIPDFFKYPVKARAVLNLSLAIQTMVTFERVGVAERADLPAGSPSDSSTQKKLSIYTEGGFRKNKGYNLLVSSLFPDAKLMLSNLREATAFGTALTAKAALENLELKALKDYIKIETETIEKYSFPGLLEYIDTFLKILEEEKHQA